MSEQLTIAKNPAKMKLSSFRLTVEALALRKIAQAMDRDGIAMERVIPVLDCADAFDAIAQELKEAGR